MKIKFLKFVLLFFLLKVFVGVSLNYINELFTIQKIAVPFHPGDLFEQIIILIVAAPLLETFIFQFLVFKVCGALISTRSQQRFLFITASALLFTLGHTQSFNFHFFLSITSGIILALVYQLSKERQYNALFTTSAIHSGYNLVILIINLLKEN